MLVVAGYSKSYTETTNRIIFASCVSSGVYCSSMRLDMTCSVPYGVTKQWWIDSIHSLVVVVWGLHRSVFAWIEQRRLAKRWSADVDCDTS